LVTEVLARLKALGAVHVQELDGVVENVTFPLPKGLGIGQLVHASSRSGNPGAE
jgi:4-hydroxy-3-methylbut-2-enyl diphosphate reductase